MRAIQLADLAALGISVDTSGVANATSSLDKLAASAGKAEKATDSAGKASEHRWLRDKTGGD